MKDSSREIRPMGGGNAEFARDSRASALTIADTMILKPGEKIHVIQRQLFMDDVRRHFVGLVDACDGTIARVTGHLFAMDHKLNQFVRRDQTRTQIISLATATSIINVIPEHVDIDNVYYKFNKVDDIIVTDGSGWHLDLSHL